MFMMSRKSYEEAFKVRELRPARGGVSVVRGKTLLVVREGEHAWAVYSMQISMHDATRTRVAEFATEAAAELFCRKQFGLVEDESCSY